MRVVGTLSGKTYMGPFTAEDYAHLGKADLEQLAARGNQKAEELGIKTRYEVKDD